MRPRSGIRMHPGRTSFNIFFAGILCLILCIWGAAGFLIYTAVTNPEAIGQHVGRAIGSAVEGYREKSGP